MAPRHADAPLCWRRAAYGAFDERRVTQLARAGQPSLAVGARPEMTRLRASYPHISDTSSSDPACGGAFDERRVDAIYALHHVRVLLDVSRAA